MVTTDGPFRTQHNRGMTRKGRNPVNHQRKQPNPPCPYIRRDLARLSVLLQSWTHSTQPIKKPKNKKLTLSRHSRNWANQNGFDFKERGKIRNRVLRRGDDGADPSRSGVRVTGIRIHPGVPQEAGGAWELLHPGPTRRSLSHLLLVRALQRHHPRRRCFRPDLRRDRRSGLRHSPRSVTLS